MIAEVALNIPLRRIFDYLLREEETSWVEPGVQVIVPFGRGLRSGIVVGLKEKSELPAEKLKRINKSAGGGVLFNDEMLNFTRWVAEYYFCSWGEVLEAALPSGMGVRIRVSYSLGKDPLIDSEKNSLSAEAQKIISTRSEWEETHFIKGGATPGDMRWLHGGMRSGRLTLTRSFAGRVTKAPVEKWVRLLPAGVDPLNLPKPPKPGKKETKKDQILRILTEEGGGEGGVPLGRLNALIKNPSSVVRDLDQKGWVLLFEKPGASRLKKEVAPLPFLDLNPEQKAAFDVIEKALKEKKYQGFLLEGVTGSGKTEVYLHGVRAAEALGRTSLVLVPEIALTESMVSRFRSRFGERVAVLHSGMNISERFDEWHRVHQGQATIVIGARSAVFAPLKNLGFLVVDEEHDGSYKQEETPRYQGRDAAILRAHKNQAVVVLGSATPSLESLHNVALSKLKKIQLTKRVENRPLPKVELLNMAVEPRVPGVALFSRKLAEAIRETLLRKEQTLLFLNRRGFASLVRCKECEAPVVCENCSITLTYHQAQGALRCHRCDYNRGMPEKCPACDFSKMEVLGIGTEKIEEEARKMFPQAKILRMDSDSLRRRGELERMLSAIRNQDYDLIIGTQILTKGHDFPHITLVGALLADVSLNMPDYRAPERTFQLLTQMAGRAGRGDLPGEVLIQTYSPEHYALKFARTHDTARFSAQEFASRKDTQSPPLSHQALVWVTGPDLKKTRSLAGTLAGGLRAVMNENRGANTGENLKNLTLLGPAEAPIRRINNRFRFMIMLQAPAVGPIHQCLSRTFARPTWKTTHKERIIIDIDPYNLL